MRFLIEPVNESQGMNCRVEFAGNRAMAAKKAVGIAASLQAALDGTDISCRVMRDDGCGPVLVAFPDGSLIDEATGNSVKLG